MAAGELYAFGWIGSALLSAAIASSKNRSGCGWLALGVVAGPLGLLASILMPARPEQAPPADGAEGAEAAERPVEAEDPGPGGGDP